MATIILRANKGSPLTNEEVDANFNNLNVNKAELNSPSFSGTPLTPTAAVDTNTAQIASCAFVLAQASSTVPLANGVASAGVSLKWSRRDHVHPSDTTKENAANKDQSNGYPGLTAYKVNFKNNTGAVVSFLANDSTAPRTYTFKDRNGTIADDQDIATRAPIASPTFTGTVSAPTFSGDLAGTISGTTTGVTQAAADSSTKMATTAFVDRLRSYLASTNVSGTLVVSDRGTLLITASSVTIPANVFSALDRLSIYNNSGAPITLTQGSSATLRLAGTATTGNRTLAQRGMAYVTFISATEIAVEGAGVT